MYFVQKSRFIKTLISSFLNSPSSFVLLFQLIFVRGVFFSGCIFFLFLKLVGYKEEKVTGLK